MTAFNLVDFFYMGGKWMFVWPCYILTALILIINLLAPKLNRRRIANSIKRTTERMRK